jgi:arylsulfatase A-like enzyme
LTAVGLLLLFLSGCSAAPSADRPPNFVVIFVDDVGWGDLGSYGHPTIRTPRLDRMAAEGQRWTQFYVASPVCSPSRGALLTGRLPVRSGIFGRRSGVFFPGDVGGIPASEVTIAEVLSGSGYATAMFGKWHLGDRLEHSPLQHGFDTWYGTPYSNDMMWTISSEREVVIEAYYDPKIEYWDLPILRDDVLVEQPADQPYLTRRYTEEAVEFIRAKADAPFFVYLAHSMAHMPLYRSPEYEGHSSAGIYGDVMEEIDWSVGRILDTLRELDIDENTLVVFASDNGPWTLFRHHGGSSGPLRGAKGETFEGGMRVPGLFWWPGTIEPDVVSDLGSTLDLLPTLATLAGASLEQDRALDGIDLTSTLYGDSSSARDEMFYYRSGELWAYRQGPFKLHFRTQGRYGLPPELEEHDPPLLYNLDDDIGERWNIAEDNGDILERMLARIEEHRESLESPEPEFDRGRGEPPVWRKN